MKLDQWIQITFIGTSAGTDMYVGGLPFLSMSDATTLPTNAAFSWHSPNFSIAVKDIKIWKAAMPVQFIIQSALKEIDGRFYSNLVYYLPVRWHLDIYPFKRTFKNQKFEI